MRSDVIAVLRAWNAVFAFGVHWNEGVFNFSTDQSVELLSSHILEQTVGKNLLNQEKLARWLKN